MRFQFKGTVPPLMLDQWYDLTEVTNTRSIAQNAMLHGWIYFHAVKAFATTGKILNQEHVHFFFKSQFLRKRRKCKVTGKYRYEDGSTAKLSTKQFSKYVEAIKEFCMEKMDYDIPNPTNNEELLFYQNQM